MPDQLDFENAAVAQRFLERQRQYNEGQKLPRRPITEAPPPVIEQPMLSVDAQFAISESAEADIIRRVQAEQARLAAEAEETTRGRDVVEVPTYDPDLTDGQLRSLLADAISEYDRCLLALGTAEGNVERSQARMDLADSQLKSFTELDADITAHRVQQIKADKHDPLPAALADAQVRRGALVDDIHSAHVAHQRLQTELEEARRELATATSLRVYVAAFVVSKHAEEIAHHLSLAMDRVELLKRQLLSASAMWITSATGATSLPLGPEARRTIPRELVPVMSNPAWTAAFKNFHDRLLNDPNAQLAES